MSLDSLPLELYKKCVSGVTIQDAVKLSSCNATLRNLYNNSVTLYKPEHTKIYITIFGLPHSCIIFSVTNKIWPTNGFNDNRWQWKDKVARNFGVHLETALQSPLIKPLMNGEVYADVRFIDCELNSVFLQRLRTIFRNFLCRCSLQLNNLRMLSYDNLMELVAILRPKWCSIITESHYEFARFDEIAKRCRSCEHEKIDYTVEFRAKGSQWRGLLD